MKYHDHNLGQPGGTCESINRKSCFWNYGITVHSEFNLPNCKQENSFVAENHNMRSSIKSVIYIDTLYFNVR